MNWYCNKLTGADFYHTPNGRCWEAKSLPPWGDRERRDNGVQYAYDTWHNRIRIPDYPGQDSLTANSRLPQPPISRTTPLGELNWASVTNICANVDLFGILGLLVNWEAWSSDFGYWSLEDWAAGWGTFCENFELLWELDLANWKSSVSVWALRIGEVGDRSEKVSVDFWSWGG